MKLDPIKANVIQPLLMHDADPVAPNTGVSLTIVTLFVFSGPWSCEVRRRCLDP